MQTATGDKKLITVWGATGHQGGAVVDALIKSGRYNVRAITRQANSDKAKKLRLAGAELYQCDMVKASMDQLAKAMEGSYGAYLMTAAFDKDSLMKEEALGKNLVNAAKQAKVQHIIWSGLDNAAKFSGGRLSVPFFTEKAHVSEYIEQMQKQNPPPFKATTIALPAFYYQNFQEFGMAQLNGDEWVFTVPQTRHLVCCDISELGQPLVKALDDPSKFNGKRVEYWGTYGTPQSYVDTFQRVTGKKARLVEVPRDQYPSKGTAEMFSWFDEFSQYGPNGQPFAETSAQRNTPGGCSNFETYLKNGGWNFSGH